jgi:DNA-binding NarL/FixJ family response regulator
MSTDPEPIRVALVEDHALVRAAIRAGLQHAPEIRLIAEITSAEEAIVTLPVLNPDVVLVDLDLPGRTGIDLIRELAPRQPRCLFIVVSVDQSDTSIIEAVRAGARGYLSKDIEPAALVRALVGIREGEAAFGRHATQVLAERFQVLLRRPAGSDAKLPELTERENEILALLADGLTDREIAEALVIGRRTVETHVGNILAKLHVSSRVQAARIYRQRA